MRPSSPSKWDLRMLRLAQHVAGWSKDPSTKVGAVVADELHRVVALGYNGFPRGVRDDTDRYASREQKYPLVVHAELNAVLNAPHGVRGCTLYVWPLPPCSECAKALIQAGVTRVCVLTELQRGESPFARLSEATETMLAEAGVAYQDWVQP